MTREQRLTMADAAVTRAASLARAAETAARGDARHHAPALAAVGNLWANIARTHTAIAEALPEDAQDAQDATEDTDV